MCQTSPQIYDIYKQHTAIQYKFIVILNINAANSMIQTSGK